ncbi:hypothetical protein JYU02_00160 [bacterium AH-315-P15]|nr:hypothetical protein [bacterium AH-315-P15]
MADNSTEFASLLYQLLIAEEVKAVKEVAAELGLKEQALYARLYGRVRFSVEEARRILAYLGDVRIADHLLGGTEYVAIKRQTLNEEDKSEGVREGATSTLFDVTDLMREVEGALSDDGRIDHREKIDIEKRLHEAERSLTALRNALKGLH